jgi:hypothetical protein
MLLGETRTSCLPSSSQWLSPSSSCMCQSSTAFSTQQWYQLSIGSCPSASEWAYSCSTRPGSSLLESSRGVSLPRWRGRDNPVGEWRDSIGRASPVDTAVVERLCLDTFLLYLCTESRRINEHPFVDPFHRTPSTQCSDDSAWTCEMFLCHNAVVFRKHIRL